MKFGTQPFGQAPIGSEDTEVTYGGPFGTVVTVDY